MAGDDMEIVEALASRDCVWLCLSARNPECAETPDLAPCLPCRARRLAKKLRDLHARASWLAEEARAQQRVVDRINEGRVEPGADQHTGEAGSP